FICVAPGGMMAISQHAAGMGRITIHNKLIRISTYLYNLLMRHFHLILPPSCNQYLPYHRFDGVVALLCVSLLSYGRALFVLEHTMNGFAAAGGACAIRKCTAIWSNAG